MASRTQNCSNERIAAARTPAVGSSSFRRSAGTAARPWSPVNACMAVSRTTSSESSRRGRTAFALSFPQGRQRDPARLRRGVPEQGEDLRHRRRGPEFHQGPGRPEGEEDVLVVQALQDPRDGLLRTHGPEGLDGVPAHGLVLVLQQADEFRPRLLHLQFAQELRRRRSDPRRTVAQEEDRLGDRGPVFHAARVHQHLPPLLLRRRAPEGVRDQGIQGVPRGCGLPLRFQELEVRLRPGCGIAGGESIHQARTGLPEGRGKTLLQPEDLEQALGAIGHLRVRVAGRRLEPRFRLRPEAPDLPRRLGPVFDAFGPESVDQRADLRRDLLRLEACQEQAEPGGVHRIH